MQQTGVQYLKERLGGPKTICGLLTAFNNLNNRRLQ
jgi:hypothetical protein